ncbi:MAG: helix-turn-helix domain-containing protein [Bacillota bacterium]
MNYLPNYITVGRKIYLVRRQNNITLRDFSKMTDLSHTNIHRIEHGNVHSKNETLSKLLNALDVSFVSDESKESMFDSIYQEIFPTILYYDYAKARELAIPLIENEAFFLRSSRFLEYHLLMFMVIIYTQYHWEKVDYYYEACEIMEPFYGFERREWFKLMKAMYLYKKNRDEESLTFINEQLEEMQSTHYKAMLYYLKGELLLKDYTQYNAALEHFDLSQKFFEEHSSFRRSNHVKAVKQRAYIYLYRFDDFLRLFNQSLQYAKQRGDFELYYYIHLNKAIYHNLIEEYDKALEMLEYCKTRNETYYFNKIFSLYRLFRDDEASMQIAEFKNANLDLITPLIYAFIDLVEKGIQNDRDDTYMEACLLFVNQAINEKDYVLIKNGISLLTRILKIRRKYKEAYQYSAKMLQIIETIN